MEIISIPLEQRSGANNQIPWEVTTSTGKDDEPLGPEIRTEFFDPRAFPLDPVWFERPQSIHGLSHTRRVLIHSSEVAASAGLDASEFESLVLAVAWHDIGRTHDGHDLEHGAKSVARIAELGLAADIEPHVLTRVFFAIELHSTYDETAIHRAASMADGESMLRVLWVLKDADGLDRVRISDLDPCYLRYPISRGLVARAWELLAQMP